MEMAEMHGYTQETPERSEVEEYKALARLQSEAARLRANRRYWRQVATVRHPTLHPTDRR